MSDLARDVGIKSQTARDWLSVLEASNQVSLLEPYFENIGKRMAKSPKLYLNDPGMLCFLLGFDEKSLPSTPLVGAIWETFVYAEFRKKIANSSNAMTLWFYRDAQACEIDFLTVASGKIDLFECKWTESPDSRWIDNLNETAGVLGRSRTQQIGERMLLCKIPTPVERQGVNCLHAADYFRGI
jgi:predicted AAA+ superfamily ATPase